jgi:Tfp pilus assembly protein PilO
LKKSRRQIINRIFEATALGLVLAVLIVFFAVYKPLVNKMAAAEQQQESLRQTVRNQQVRAEVLKRYEILLPQVGKGLSDFSTNRTPERREAYSTAAHLITKLADASGVRVATRGYHFDKNQRDPLWKLQLDLNVEGPYAGLMKFSHALETANNFLLVREFNFTPGGDNQPLNLRLGADFYVTP